MEKMKLVVGILAFGAFLAVAYFAYNILQDVYVEEPVAVPSRTMANLQQAPDFAMYDAYGNEVWLSDFRGQTVVLNFWATWCRVCVQETPYFDALYQERGDEIKLLKVVLLDGQRETMDRVNAFMEEGGYTFPLYFDTTGAASRAFGLRFIPMTFFIDADGYIVRTIQGAADEESLNFS